MSEKEKQKFMQAFSKKAKNLKKRKKNEAVECFFSSFEVRRNKKYKDRYQLTGETISGRSLKIIFQLKPKGIVRISSLVGRYDRKELSYEEETF